MIRGAAWNRRGAGRRALRVAAAVTLATTTLVAAPVAVPAPTPPSPAVRVETRAAARAPDVSVPIASLGGLVMTMGLAIPLMAKSRPPSRSGPRQDPQPPEMT